MAPSPPRVLYATAMLIVAAISTALAFAAARSVASQGPAVLQTTALIAAVSLIGLLPVLVNSAQRFGLAVLGASMARWLLAMFAAVILTEVVGIESRPVWFGVIAGAGFGLIAETTIAIAVLSSMERKKTTTTTALPTHSEPSTTC